MGKQFQTLSIRPLLCDCVIIPRSLRRKAGGQHLARRCCSYAFTYRHSPGGQSVALQGDFPCPVPLHRLGSSGQELLLHNKMQRVWFCFQLCLSSRERGKQMQLSNLAICQSLRFHILPREHHKGLRTDRFAFRYRY